ncbi:MAG: hypothetical protein ACRDRZ_11320 [Pseudonocardiaceae bacterium]
MAAQHYMAAAGPARLGPVGTALEAGVRHRAGDSAVPPFGSRAKQAPAGMSRGSADIPHGIPQAADSTYWEVLADHVFETEVVTGC